MIWNGARWRKVADPVPKGWSGGRLDGVSCTSAVYCVAVGSYVKGASATFPVAEAWNGTAWTARRLPGLPGGTIFATGVSCAATRHCVVAMASNPKPTSGQAFIDTLNGAKWTVHALTPPKGSVEADFSAVSCVSVIHCVMAGVSYGRTAETALVATWNGKAVATMKTAAAFPVDFSGVSCASAKSCVAVGTWFTGAADLGYYGVWNGRVWKGARVLPQPSSMVVSSPLAVSCPAPGECVAVGYFRVPVKGQYPNQPLAEFYNGKSWKRLSVPVPAGAEDTDLNAVSCLSPAWCVAVGEALSGIGPSTFSSAAVTAFWNGRSWKLVSAS